MRIEVIIETSREDLNRVIAERNPDRVESVSAHSMHDLCGYDATKVLNRWTEYIAVLYWDDFCEWQAEGKAFLPGCDPSQYRMQIPPNCTICGRPVRVRLEPKP